MRYRAGHWLFGEITDEEGHVLLYFPPLIPGSDEGEM